MKAISARQLSITLIPPVVLLVVVVAVNLVNQVNPGNMTRDMAAIAGIHPLSGILSNLGILLWCVPIATAPGCVERRCVNTC